MARMGHDSERAALIYLHSSAERQRMLADEVGRMAAAELAKSKAAKPSATPTAREPNGPLTRLAALSLTWVNDVRPDRDSNAGPTA
jgi:hypothetical protein